MAGNRNSNDVFDRLCEQVAGIRGAKESAGGKSGGSRVTADEIVGAVEGDDFTYVEVEPEELMRALRKSMGMS